MKYRKPEAESTSIKTKHSCDASRTEVDGLLEGGLGEQARSVRDTTTGWDDLSTTAVNRIGVELS